MRMSMAARVGLIVVAVVVGLGAAALYSLESEYGGNEAIEGLAKGALPDGAVEIRDTNWGFGPETAIDYEVVVEGNEAVVRLIDGGGRILYSGPAGTVEPWLDEQGSQMYVGTGLGAYAYLADLRDDAKSYTLAIALGVVAAVLLAIAVIPNRQSAQTQKTTPAPTT